jgi:hypothetical protein
MKKFISKKLAGIVFITISTIALFMHVLILLNVLPHDFVWGGRLKSEENLILLESLSIIVQIIFISLIAVKAGYLFKGRFKRTANVGTWVIFSIMLLNTIGNLASNSALETMVMTPVTIVLALLAFRLAIEK